MEKVAKKKKSGWKWAFFLLLLLNMGVIDTIVYMDNKIDRKSVV